MNKFTKVALVAVLLCFGALILSLWPRSKSVRSFRSLNGVSVDFVGVTTNATGEVSVLFRLHNEHDRSIKYFVGSPQIQNAGQWPDRLPTIRNPTQVFVGSRREVNFSIRAPRTNEPWRVPVGYVWVPRSQGIVDWLSLHVLPRLRGTPRVYQVPDYTIFSPAITR
jgi:hypothetical protein